MTAVDYIETCHPQACRLAKKWLRSLPEDTTLEQAWSTCDRPEWMLWLVAESAPTVEQGYICADLTIGWAADALDLAGVQHGLRDLAPITGRETARATAEAARATEAATVMTARAAWAAARAARSAWAALVAGGAVVAVVAKHAWGRMAGVDSMHMANQIRARLTCPYKEDEG